MGKVDGHDVTGEVLGGGGAQPQLAGTAHGVLQRLAVHAEHHEGVALLDIGQGQRHLVAVGRGERDGVGVSGNARLVHDVHELHAGDLGVCSGAHVGAVAGAGAAHLHGKRRIVGELVKRGGKGVVHVAAHREGPLVKRLGSKVSTGLRAAQVLVRALEVVLDLGIGRHRGLIEPERALNCAELHLVGHGRSLHFLGGSHGLGGLRGSIGSRQHHERRGACGKKGGGSRQRDAGNGSLRGLHGYFSSLALCSAVSAASAAAPSSVASAAVSPPSAARFSAR